MKYHIIFSILSICILFKGLFSSVVESISATCQNQLKYFNVFCCCMAFSLYIRNNTTVYLLRQLSCYSDSQFYSNGKMLKGIKCVQWDANRFHREQSSFYLLTHTRWSAIMLETSVYKDRKINALLMVEVNNSYFC